MTIFSTIYKKTCSGIDNIKTVCETLSLMCFEYPFWFFTRNRWPEYGLWFRSIKERIIRRLTALIPTPSTPSIPSIQSSDSNPPSATVSSSSWERWRCVSRALINSLDDYPFSYGFVYQVEKKEASSVEASRAEPRIEQVRKQRS